jgi:hypothetical protein
MARLPVPARKAKTLARKAPALARKLRNLARQGRRGERKTKTSKRKSNRVGPRGYRALHLRQEPLLATLPNLAREAFAVGRKDGKPCSARFWSSCAGLAVLRASRKSLAREGVGHRAQGSTPLRPEVFGLHAAIDASLADVRALQLTRRCAVTENLSGRSRGCAGRLPVPARHPSQRRPRQPRFPMGSRSSRRYCSGKLTLPACSSADGCSSRWNAATCVIISRGT